MKKYLLISISLFLIFSMKINALDTNKKGSIEIYLKEGLEISLYHIADIKEINNNITYTYINELKECKANLNDLKAKEIELCLNNEVKSVKKTSNGIVQFDNLSLGIYLVKPTNKVENSLIFDSLLITIPTIQNNNLIYHIKAKPKTEIYELIDIKVNKVWNTKNQKMPNSVTIELYNDNSLIDTIVLNEENSWTYILHNLEKSDKYRVKEINIPKGYVDSYKQNNYEFTITNTNKLPNTGQNYYIIYILGIIGFILILIGYINLKKEEK